MKYLLVLLTLLFLINCASPTGPDSSGMHITVPATYIEVEDLHPQDTVWWTFTANGECYAAWKRKITEVSGAPPWVPHCKGTDAQGNCAAYRTNSNGEILGTDGRTHQEYLDFWAAQIAGFLPTAFYAGTWGSVDGWILTLNINRVIPGSYGGKACDIRNSTKIQTQLESRYIAYDFWNDDSLYGYICDIDGEPIDLQHSDPNVKWSRWHGKHLFDKTNSIFE
jgi:hypothetical protein